MVGIATLESVRVAGGTSADGAGAKVTAGELLTLQVFWHVPALVSQFIVQVE